MPNAHRMPGLEAYVRTNLSPRSTHEKTPEAMTKPMFPESVGGKARGSDVFDNIKGLYGICRGPTWISKELQ